MDIKEMAKNIQNDVVAFRRELHANPELSLQEFETTRRVARELDRLGVSYRLTEPTGLIAELKGTKSDSGHCVLLRADMDALPIQEKTELAFSSQIEGVMHACGHDTHTAMLFGSIKLLYQLREQFSGTIRFVFQPAEEVSQGAKLMIAQGATEGVDMAMGLHISTQVPLNELRTRSGGYFASSDHFTIRVIGRGGHASSPEHTVDPVYAAASIIQLLQSMVSREFPPLEPVVASVCTINTAGRYNTIPDEVVMEGTCRCFAPKVWEQLPIVLDRIVQQTAASLRCQAEIKFERTTKPLVCDQAATAILEQSIQKIIDDPTQYREANPVLGSEDFAEFAARVPAAFVQLGAGSDITMHNCHVNFDEDAFVQGVACYAQFALDALEQLNRA